MQPFWRKKPETQYIPTPPVEELQSGLDTVVEPSIEWFNDLPAGRKAKFIVLGNRAFVAMDHVYHWDMIEASRIEPDDMQKEYEHGEKLGIQPLVYSQSDTPRWLHDAGKVRLNTAAGEPLGIVLYGFSTDFWRADSEGRERTASLFTAAMNGFSVTVSEAEV